jgi:hypothetical protein
MKQHTPNASPLNLTFALTWGLILLTMGLTACDKPGPAQEAGRQVDEEAKQINTSTSDADITAKVKLALMMRDGLNLSLLQKGT